jgi:hypothetical protein
LPRDEEAPINVVRLDGEDEESEPKKVQSGSRRQNKCLGEVELLKFVWKL